MASIWRSAEEGQLEEDTDGPVEDREAPASCWPCI